MERLVKWVSHHGGLARRKADEAIFSGRVTVNGTIERNPATRIQPETDHITLDGILLVQNQQKIIMLKMNKPSGYVCTNSDEEGKKTIFELVDPTYLSTRLYCVGRLDKESEGLLLITNNGDVHLQLSHPRYEKEKVYTVYFKGEIDDTRLNQLRDGVDIELDEGRYHTQPCSITLRERTPKKTKVEMTLKEGKKRQIRKMAEAIGSTVMYLRRTQMGPIYLGNLPIGGCIPISPSEEKTLLSQLALS